MKTVPVCQDNKEIRAEKGLDKKGSIGYIFDPCGSSDPDGTQIVRKPKVCFLKKSFHIFMLRSSGKSDREICAGTRQRPKNVRGSAAHELGIRKREETI